MIPVLSAGTSFLFRHCWTHLATRIRAIDFYVFSTGSTSTVGRSVVHQGDPPLERPLQPPCAAHEHIQDTPALSRERVVSISLDQILSPYHPNSAIPQHLILLEWCVSIKSRFN